MIPDKMVDAARDGCWVRGEVNMRAALEAAGVGELIDALKPLALEGSARTLAESEHIRRARAMLEKYGITKP